VARRVAVGWSDSEVKPTFHYTMGKGGETWREQIELARAAGFAAIDVDLRAARTIEAEEILEALAGMVASR